MADYTGRELESMGFAVRYHRWILDVFRPFLGKHIVEVGAGQGAFSQLILRTQPQRFDAVEPSENLYPRLVEHLSKIDAMRVAYPHRGTLPDVVECIRENGRPHSVIYVNVLEHIEDDLRELQAIHSLLRPGGRVLIFVPAHPWLMAGIDRHFGHFRRYTRTELERDVRDAGFTIRLSSYFDLLGLPLWWIKYRVLQAKTLDLASVRFADRYVVPVSRMLESLVRPPTGKNIILVGEKQVAD